MKINKGLSVRIYPNLKQRIWLNQQFGNIRFIWNYFLDYIETNYKKGEKFPRKYDLYNMLKPLKETNQWLKESDSRSLQDEIGVLHTTYEHMFKGICRKPRFKSRKNPRQSYSTSSISSQNKCGNHNLKVAKLGFVKAHFSSKIDGKIKKITIMKKPTGKYYASLTLECENQTLPKTNRAVGIDVGIEHLLNLSNGTKFNLRNFNKGIEHKKYYWQVRLARRRTLAKEAIKSDRMINHNYPSHVIRNMDDFKNYNKAKRMVAKYFDKEKSQRKNYLQWLSTYLVKRYDTICIEDLNPSNMVKNHHLARNIANASWRQFRTMLEYKCNWYGKELKAINKDFTSQICSYCLTQTGKKKLNVRSFYCPNEECPYHNKEHDRDINASINILNLGLGKVKTLKKG